MRKSIIWVSNQVRHKVGCTGTAENSQMLEMSDFERRGTILSIEQKQRQCFSRAVVFACADC